MGRCFWLLWLCTALVRADDAPALFGPAWPYGVGQHLLANYAGEPAAASDWQVRADGLATDHYRVQPSWDSLRVELTAAGRLVLARRFDLDVSARRWLVVCGQPVGDLRVQVLADTDAGPVGPVAPDRHGLAVLPLYAHRLTGLAIELRAGAPPARGKPRPAAYELRWLALREPERNVAAVHAFANRAAVVSWTRPFWGAERYLVTRDRGESTDPSRAPAISAGRAGLTPWVIDTPPESGRWVYAVAPLEGRRAGLWSQTATVLGAQPVPTIGTLDLPVTIDGDLNEWRPRFRGATIAISTRNGCAIPADQVGAAGRAATVRLFADQTRLYLAAEVTEPTPAAGERVELRLGGLRFESGRFAGRYDVTVLYGADGTSPVPGRYAARRRDRGYTIEAELPLSYLRQAGVDLTTADWVLLGLAVRRADTANEPEGWLSWNARHRVDDPLEAALARVVR